MRALLRRPSFWLATASLFLVVGLFVLDVGDPSPGPLTRTHGREDRLQGSAGCAVCHGDAETSLDVACVDCHAPIAAQLSEGAGFHGGLSAAESTGSCATCHLEHHGDDRALVDARAFELAGVPERDAFRHEGLSFALHGAHERSACVDCHEHADAALLPVGAVRFLGLDATCTGCHEDVHAGTLGADCERCHGQERPFAEAGGFVHSTALPLRGVHAGVTCSACHPAGVEELVRGSGAARHDSSAVATRACVDCHASPHRRGFLEQVAVLDGGRVETGCVRCHALDGGAFADPDARLDLEAHASTGFALSGAHAEKACAACHAGGRAAAMSASPEAAARPVRDCAACHADPHDPSLLAGAAERTGLPIASTCTVCHRAEPAGFREPVADFDAGWHALVGFPLDPPHDDVDCAACHDDAVVLARASVARSRSDPPRADAAAFADFFERHPGRGAGECAACHVDPHGGSFEQGPFGGRGCLACHDRHAFQPVVFDATRHAEARFALTGAHRAVGCYECHVAPPGAADGRVSRAEHVFAGTPTGCAGCHDDVHRAAIPPGAPCPIAFDPAADCGDCHDTTDFRNAGEAFDHALAGFELRGAHARAECSACHARGLVPGTVDRELGLALLAFPGPRQDCATCHTDPHAGAFRRPPAPEVLEGRRGCARCHQADTFREVRIPFAHGRWTDFRLEGAHRAAECVACHAPVAAEDGGPDARRFGPALGSDCTSCHADPHVGQFARGGRSDCSRCHTTGSFAVTGFDHARDTRFTLDATHAELDCGACHQPHPLPGGRSAIRYRPLGTQCVDCHGPGGSR